MKPDQEQPEPGPRSAEESAAAPSAILTGERVVDEHFTPGESLDLEAYIAAHDLTAIHHLVRYLWAARVLADAPPPSTLLDLGCGSGYGAFLLASSLPATAVCAVDYDPEAVAAANERYSRENLEFRVGDPTDWDTTIGTSRFEVVTSFDVIEHVLHRELYLEGIVNHLYPEGRLLLSTPCGAGRNILKPGWEHHRIEYSARSLFDLLRRYFSSVLGSDRPDFPHRSVFEALHARGIDYLLRLNPVICRQPIVVANPYDC